MSESEQIHDPAFLNGDAGKAEAITQARREAALLNISALQNTIFNSANFSSIATDEKGVIQFFNVGAERMLGYAATDVLHKITPADISEERCNAALQRSNAELEQFAYVASHDLQEPLRKVIGYANLLAKRYQDKLDANANEFLSFTVDGATRMRQLIQDLLAYSRVGQQERAFDSVNCVDVLTQVLRNLQVAIEESGAVVTHDPLPTVLANGRQIAQLLQNLVSNAIKFRDEQPPCIHIAATRSTSLPALGVASPAEWVFAVRDHGIGLDPQYADRIFRIFQRLHSREAYPGTGIGLAICKKILDHHGGRIWVESQPGHGSTFYFTLPERSGCLAQPLLH